MALRVYGIASCDTCRKARKWLDGQGIAHAWIDLRASPPDRKTLQRWLDAVGHAGLINRRSTTWRGLDERERAAAGGAGAVDLLHRHPTLIKRPVFVLADALWVGFDDASRKRLGEWSGRQ